MINKILINAGALKKAISPDFLLKDVQNDLIAEGATVEGFKTEDGLVIMSISGNIDEETIEAVFDEYKVNVDDFIITEEEYIPDYDEVETEVFDNKNNKNGNAVNEKKKDGCCPKKKGPYSGNLINLAEACAGVDQRKPKVSLNDVIDDMSGKTVNESRASMAIQKARSESKKNFLIQNLGEKKYEMIRESLEAGKTSLYEKVKVNQKPICEYSLDELCAIREKTDKKISGLAEDSEDYKKFSRLKEILEDEISYRKSLEILQEDDAPQGFEFKNLDPNKSGDESDEKKEDKKEDEKKDEEKKEAKNESEDATDDEKKDGENDEKADDEQNPDEDEEVEIGSIVITLASKDAAEDLGQDLADAGVPEEAYEIVSADEDEEESDEDEEKSDEDEEKSDEEKAEEESPKESAKSNGSNAVNEDDNDTDADADNNDDVAVDDGNNNEDDEEKSEDGSYKLILKDTDYIEQLSDVLQNIWGMEQSEFEELIGGEIVKQDSDDEEEKSDEDEDGDEEKKKDDEETSDEMDFDPEEIFKDL